MPSDSKAPSRRSHPARPQTDPDESSRRATVNVVDIQIARRIVEARNQASLSRLELADRLNISREHLSRVENGELRISAALVSQIALALDVKIEWFFEDQSQSNKTERVIKPTGTPSRNISALVDAQRPGLESRIDELEKRLQSLKGPKKSKQ